MATDFGVRALEMVFQIPDALELMNTDQGAQFTSTAFIDILQQHRIQICMDVKVVTMTTSLSSF